MSRKLVSIVIVCYNNWPDIVLAIQSSLQQTYKPIEVIVVDNGSLDATSLEVHTRFGQRLKYVRQENRGDAAGYNTGIRAAKGEFLQFLDGDDFLAPDKIEMQAQLLIADPSIDIVYGDSRRFRGPAGVAHWEEVQLAEQEDMLEFFIATEGGLAAASLLYRRRTLERLGPWDESLYISDVDYWLRSASAGCRFRYCPGSLAFYRQRPDQMTANHLSMLRGGEVVFAKALSYIDSPPHRSAIETKLARRRWFLALLDLKLRRREAVKMVLLSRATEAKKVGLPAVLVALVLILLPGGRRLLSVPWLRALRSLARSLLGPR